MKKFLIFVLIAIGIFLICGPVQADLSSGLLTYYPFNGNANDESGNGNDGIEKGTVDYVAGLAGKAVDLEFSSPDNHIAINKTITLNDFCISFWVDMKENTRSKISYFFSGANSSNYNMLLMAAITTSVENEYYMEYFQGKHRFAVGEYPVITAKFEASFNHILYNRNGSTITIYVNGSSVGNYVIDHESLTLEYSVIGLDQDCLGGCFGKYGNLAEEELNAVVDEMRIYNRSLSESEIQQLYAGRGSTVGDYDAGYQAGINFCKSNPSACGITTGDNSSCPPTGTTILNPDLSFSISNLSYQTLLGNMEMEANFKFFNEQSGKLLWELESYKVK